MAKAGFSLLFRRFPGDPITVLGHLNRHLFEILQRRKMMTGLVLLLDPVARIVSQCNAGQTPPLMVPPDGPITFLEDKGSFPLGVKKSRSFALREVPFGEGVLLLYTDGLVEAQTPDRQPVGYERFRDIAGEAVRDSREAPIDAVFRRIAALTDPVPWDDDATVVLIRALRGGSS